MLKFLLVILVSGVPTGYHSGLFDTKERCQKRATEIVIAVPDAEFRCIRYRMTPDPSMEEQLK